MKHIRICTYILTYRRKHVVDDGFSDGPSERHLCTSAYIVYSKYLSLALALHNLRRVVHAQSRPYTGRMRLQLATRGVDYSI